MNDKVNIIELNDASSLAKIISSKTAHEIIRFIGDNDKCTASQIKTGLNLPASTVHYNIKALVESEIVDDSQFSYSSKGKEVCHYSLTNKILIVVPKKQDIMSQLKAFVPGLLTVGAVAGVALLIKAFKGASQEVFMQSNDVFASKMVESEMVRAAPLAADFAGNNLPSLNPWYFSSEFFIGLGVAVVCRVGAYIVFRMIKRRTHR